ncbi:MAG: hypothetical protein ABEJ79_00550 [Halolamina sp.]
MSRDDGSPEGAAQFCRDCQEPYREVKRLPGVVGLCPTCFEQRMYGDD